MTVNDFLAKYGKEPLNRDLEEKTTMLVKNFDDTKWGKRSPYPCIVMEKLDGVCALAINIEGEVQLYSRTGRRLQNVGYLEDLLEHSALPESTVLCVEVCNPELSLEQISGIVNPNRVEPLDDVLGEIWLHGCYLGAFDVISLNEFITGESYLPFNARLSFLEKLKSECVSVTIPYYTLCNTDEEALNFHHLIVGAGGEGTVQCLLEMPWKAGYKNHAKTKRVRGVDFDLEVLGVEEGRGKRAGMAAKLLLRWRMYGKPDGKLKVISVDGRFSEDERIAMLANPQNYIGKIVHVHALQLGSKGLLRLAKVRSFRMDKHTADL